MDDNAEIEAQQDACQADANPSKENDIPSDIPENVSATEADSNPEVPESETIGDESQTPTFTVQDDALSSHSVHVDPNAPKKEKKKIVITKKKVVKSVKYLLILLFLASLRAVTNHVFIIPNAFAPGGLSGISSIIYNAILPVNPKLANSVFDPGITTFVMNLPFIIAAFFVINKKFAINTFLVVVTYSGVMTLLNHVNCPQFAVPDDNGLRILAAFAGGAITGVLLGFMLRNNMSMGGTDIVGKIIHKYKPSAGTHIWILLCDCLVAVASCTIGILKIVRGGIDLSTGAQNISIVSKGVVAVLSPILYSFVSLFTGSFTADIVQSGYQSSIVFTIITDKPDEISLAISNKLHRGITLSTAIGYYTKAEHKVLTVVVSKRQILNVKKIVQKADPLAFTYITKASEVAGKGFHSAG